MQNWLNVPDKDKASIYNEIANQTGLTPYAVEKDWWVTQTIGEIFQTNLAPHLVFKGGTSLSKAWNLIERFSEDIDFDLVFDFASSQVTEKQRGKIDPNHLQIVGTACRFI